MVQLDQITQHNASAAEQLAASSEQMTNQAQHLRNKMRYFTVQEA